MNKPVGGFFGGDAGVVQRPPAVHVLILHALFMFLNAWAFISGFKVAYRGLLQTSESSRMTCEVTTVNNVLREF